MPYVDTIYNIHSYIHIDKTHTYIYIYIIKHVLNIYLLAVATIYAWLVGMMEERSPNWNSK